MKIRCTKCGSTLVIPAGKVPKPGAFAKCPKCGNRFSLSPQKVEKAGCPKCGHPVSGGEVCEKCGIVFRKYKPPELETAKGSGETKNEAAEGDIVKCPECAMRFLREAGTCPGCGTPLEKIPESWTESLKNLKNIDTEAVKQNALEIAWTSAVDFVRAYTVLVIIFIIVSLFIGISFFAVFFGSDREIMYSSGFSPCKSRLMEHPDLNMTGAICIVNIGNTGEEEIESLRVRFDNIPKSVDQVFFTLQNLSAADKRSHDPMVFVICGESLKKGVQKMPAAPWTGLRDRLSQLYAEAVLQEGYYDPDNPPEYHEFRDPCRQTDGLKIFRLERLAAGGMVRLGFVIYGRAGVFDWKSLESVDIELEGDAKIIKSDPQASTLVRLFQRLFDLF